LPDPRFESYLPSGYLDGTVSPEQGMHLWEILPIYSEQEFSQQKNSVVPGFAG
jgi:hypothetical protein